jgi:dynein heavy chain
MLNPLSWESIYSAELRSAGQFEGITGDIIDNWETWKKWAQEENPFDTDLPGEWSQKLSKFDKLLLIKCFRYELL